MPQRKSSTSPCIARELIRAGFEMKSDIQRPSSSRPAPAPPGAGRRAWGFVFLALALIWGAIGSLRAAAAEGSTPPTPVTRAAAPALPASVDLRPVFEERGLARRTQGQRGTCSVFVVAGALEFAAARQQRHAECFSVEFLNWGANRIDGKNKDGGFFTDLWRAFAAYGICSETAMPYRASFDPALVPTPQALTEAKARLALGLQHHWIKEWNVKTGLTQEQLLAIKRTLSQGWPVCAGLRWPRKPVWSDDVLQMCPAEAVYDGHSVLLVGYRDAPKQLGGGRLLFRNTGDGGRDAFMPYTYARSYLNDAVWIDFPPADKPGL